MISETAGWPDDIHYDGGKLARLAVMGAVIAGLGVWLFLDRDIITNAGGSSGRLVRLLGPDVVRPLMGLVALASIGFALAYLRLLVGHDRLAVHADDTGITLRTLLASRHHSWAEIARLEVERFRPTTQEMTTLRLVTADGRRRGLAMNAMVEADDYADYWVEAVAARQTSARGKV